MENTVNLGKRVKVLDGNGDEIANVVRFDTVTCEVDVVITSRPATFNRGSTCYAQDSNGDSIAARGFVRGAVILIDGVIQP